MRLYDSRYLLTGRTKGVSQCYERFISLLTGYGAINSADIACKTSSDSPYGRDIMPSGWRMDYSDDELRED